MSKTSKTTALTGEFISEDAVRGALARRTNEKPKSPGRSARPLRRWSVAELLARALVAPPRVDGMSH